MMKLETGTTWIPRNQNNPLPWKLTKIFTASDGETVFRLEKYQGGRNSPAFLSRNQLLSRFTHDS